MTDNDLGNWLKNPWFSIAAKAVQAKKGKPLNSITKEEVAQVIESSTEPIPPIIRHLIAQMLRGEFKSQRGIQAKPYSTRRNAVMHFLEIQEVILKDQSLNNQNTARGELTLREQALVSVSQAYFVTPRTLENWIKEHEKITLEAHRRTGREFKALHEALTYERNLLARAKYISSLQGWPIPPLK
jgi:hypothetical protein